MQRLPAEAARRASRWLPLALPLAVLALGLPSLAASFQFDDWQVIVHDPRVQSLAAWWASMPGIRPLLKASYALNASLGGTTAGYRLFNLLLHGCNALLLERLLRQRALAAGLPVAAALFAAALFALHPVQTESVTYLSGRSGALAAFFCLLALWAWQRGTARWRCAALAAFVLAIACKETALALPLMLWAWEATGGAQARRTSARGWLVLSVPVLLVLWLALAWPPYRHLLDVSLATRTVASNLLTQSHAVLYLAGELLRPWHQDIDPQLAVVQGVGFVDIALLAGWAALAVLAAWQRHRHPQAAFALLWFLACLAPTNSLLPRLDVANDRELYLALAGPAWLVAVALVRMPWRVAVPLGVALIALLAGCTLLRNRDYADEVGFWQAALHSSPGNARAANNLGMAYALDCRDRAARAWFERAVALAPGDYRARINLRLLRSGELVTPAERRCGQGGGHGSNPE